MINVHHDNYFGDDGDKDDDGDEDDEDEGDDYNSDEDDDDKHNGIVRGFLPQDVFSFSIFYWVYTHIVPECMIDITKI